MGQTSREADFLRRPVDAGMESKLQMYADKGQGTENVIGEKGKVKEIAEKKAQKAQKRRRENITQRRKAAKKITKACLTKISFYKRKRRGSSEKNLTQSRLLPSSLVPRTIADKTARQAANWRAGWGRQKWTPVDGVDLVD